MKLVYKGIKFGSISMSILKYIRVNRIKQHQVLGLILLLGLIIGLTFVFLLPPWQHYDEPGQFEFAWLLANREGFPKAGEYDQSIRREIASSMIEHNFFRFTYRPNLISITEPIWIGVSQVGSSPLYFLMTSIALRFIQSSDVVLQLYIARLFSLILYLVTLGASYGVAIELTPPKHPLRWLLPTSILLLPGFVDLQTAFNDDVGATAFFSLFLWTGIRLMRRGFRWLTFGGFVLLAIMCFFTKTTVLHAVLLGTIPVLFSIIRGANRRYLWIAFALGLIFSVLFLFKWGYPRNWIPESTTANTMRGSNLQAPAGKHVFEFRLTPDSRNAALTQIIPGKNNDSKEKVITVGAWIWADSPLTVQTPVLLVDYRGREIFNQVEVTEEPRFYTFTDTVEASERLVNLSISPAPKQGDDTIMVYYDGILVVEGDWPDNSIPIFDDPNGNSGLWGDREFTNLIRNASAEQSGFNFRSWVDTYIGTRIPGSPSTYLGTFLDPEPLIPHYRASLIFLLQTFWARFGWARVLLVEYRTYRILGYITLTGLIGAALAFWRNRRAIQWDIMLFLGLALVTTWGATILRGLPSLLHGGSFMGPARYAYPVIIPTMLVLDIGWLELMNQIEQKFRIPQRFQLLALIIFFVLLNILSIYSIYVHYYG